VEPSGGNPVEGAGAEDWGISMNRVEISWYKFLQSLKNKQKPPKTIKCNNIIIPKNKVKVTPKQRRKQKKQQYSKKTYVCLKCRKRIVLHVKKGTKTTQCPLCNSIMLPL